MPLWSFPNSWDLIFWIRIILQITAKYIVLKTSNPQSGIACRSNATIHLGCWLGKTWIGRKGLSDWGSRIRSAPECAQQSKRWLVWELTAQEPGWRNCKSFIYLEFGWNTRICRWRRTKMLSLVQDTVDIFKVEISKLPFFRLWIKSRLPTNQRREAFPWSCSRSEERVRREAVWKSGWAVGGNWTWFSHCKMRCFR